MNLLKLVLCFIGLGFFGCAEVNIKPHMPTLKSTREISKVDGTYRILTVKGNTSALDKILNNIQMKCSATNFSMPRGNTVGSFIREIFEQELDAAKKLSLNGTPIEVVVKSIELETTNTASGTWTVEIDYNQNEKTTNIKNIIEFESKFSMLSSCKNASNIFEEALVDNFVDFIKKKP